MSDVSVKIVVETGEAGRAIESLSAKLASLKGSFESISEIAAKNSGNPLRKVTEGLNETVKAEESASSRRQKVRELDLKNLGTFAKTSTDILKVMKADFIKTGEGFKQLDLYSTLVAQSNKASVDIKESNSRLQNAYKNNRENIKNILNQSKIDLAASTADEIKLVQEKINAIARMQRPTQGSVSSLNELIARKSELLSLRELEKKSAQDILKDAQAAANAQLELERKNNRAVLEEKRKALKEEEKISKQRATLDTPKGAISAYNASITTSQLQKDYSSLETAAKKVGYTGTTAAELAKFASVASNATAIQTAFTGRLYESIKAVQLLDGPLGGVAYRLTVLKNVMSSTGMQIVGTVGAIAAFGYVITKIVASANAMTSVTAQMKALTSSAGEYKAAMSNVVAISERQHLDLQSTAKFYARLQGATKDLGYSQNVLGKITETVAAGFRINGTSAGEASAAMMQLTQALGSGRLQGDEFRSMAENAQVTMQKLAKAILGPAGNVEALRKMATDGKLTTSIVTQGFLEISDSTIALSKTMPTTLGQAMTDLATSFSKIGMESTLVNKGLSFTASSISTVAKSLPEIITQLKILATALVLTSAYARASAVNIDLASVSFKNLAASSALATAAFRAFIPFLVIEGLVKYVEWLKKADESTALLSEQAAKSAEKLEKSTAGIATIVDALKPFSAESKKLGGEFKITSDMSAAAIASMISNQEGLTEKMVVEIKAQIGLLQSQTEAFAAADLAAYNSLNKQKQNLINQDVKKFDPKTGVIGEFFEMLGIDNSEQINKITAQLDTLAEKQKTYVEQSKKQKEVLDRLEPGVRKGSATDIEQKRLEDTNKILANTNNLKGKELAINKELWKVAIDLKYASLDDFKKGLPEVYDKRKAALETQYDLTKKAEEAQKGVTKAVKETGDASESVLDKFNTNATALSATIKNQTSEYDTQRRLIDASNGNLDEAAIKFEVLKVQNELKVKAQKEELVLSDKFLSKIEEEVTLREKAKLLNDASLKNIQDKVKAGEDFANSIERNISDGIYSGFTKGTSSFLTSLKNSFFRGVSDLIAGGMKNALLPSIGALFGVGGNSSFNPMGGNTALSNISTSGGFLSTLSQGASALSGISALGGLSSDTLGMINTFGTKLGIGSMSSLSAGEASFLSQAGVATPGLQAGTGLGDMLKSTFSFGNIAGGIGGGLLGNAVFGGGGYSSIGSTAGGLAGSYLGALGSLGGPLGALAGSFIGSGIGSLFGGKTPHPASVFSYTDASGAGYGSKHMDTSTAQGMLQELLSTRDTLIASVPEALGKQLKASNYFSGGVDNGKGQLAIGNYNTSSQKVLFDPNSAQDAKEAYGKFGIMLARTVKDLSPTLTSALDKIKVAGKDTAEILSDVAFVLNFENLGTKKDVITQTVQAFNDLNKVFDDARDKAIELGLAEAKVEAMRSESISAFRTDLTANTFADLNSLINPQYAATQAEKRRYDTQLADAKTVGSSTVPVEMLHQVNLLRIETQYGNVQYQAMLDTQKAQLQAAQESLNLWQNLPQSLTDSINSLKLSDKSILSPAEKLAEARSQYQAIANAAKGGDANAVAKLAESGNTLLEISKNYNASSTAYVSDYTEVLNNLVSAKSLSELQFDITKKTFDELTKQTALMEKQGTTTNGQTYANVNETVIRLRDSGKLSGSDLDRANSVLVAGAPGVIPGGGRLTAAYNNNPEANAAAVLTLRAMGIKGFASGGMITGGIPGRDSVPALLMPGERVLSRSQAKEYDSGASTAEIRALRQQVAQMQASMSALVSLTSEGNDERRSQTRVTKRVADGR